MVNRTGGSEYRRRVLNFERGEGGIRGLKLSELAAYNKEVRILGIEERKGKISYMQREIVMFWVLILCALFCALDASSLLKYSSW
jgi:hypothetical protein